MTEARRIESLQRFTSTEQGLLPPHVGTLSPEQAKALDELKQLCQQEGLYTPASEKDGKVVRASHDDPTLL
jgi:hypothetical protein